MPLEGQQIGRYRLGRLLGSGGMGDVYLAEDARIEQHVAIKVIRAEISPYSEGRPREEAARLFLREARAITKLDHPNILPLFDFGEEQIGDTTIMYLVMPYRQEGSLVSWLRRRAGGALLSPQEVAHVVQQAATALQHAHNRQVIHQDVKPSNFLLRSREDTHDLPDLLLADFGIARFMTATSSASQSIRGTPSYMAPEQWEGEAVPATDQYALAVMAYELLTGRLPFQGGPGKMMYQHMNVQPQPPSSLNARLSSDIDTVLLHALAKQPEQRFASMAAFAHAFQQVVQEIQSDEEISPTSNLEGTKKTILPAAMLGINTIAPTVPRSDMQPVGSDSETFVKPIDTPVSLTPAASLQQAVLLPENVAPVVTTDARPRKARRRPLLMVASIVLALALVGGGIAYGVPALIRNGFGKNIPGASPGRPDTTTSAIVTITPASQNLRNTFTITATPNPSQQQVEARVITTTTPTQSQTVQATGQGTIPATQATGILGLSSTICAQSTIPAGTLYYYTRSLTDYVTIATNAPVTLNAGNICGPQQTVAAHAVQAGSAGNFPAGLLGFGGGVSETAVTPFTGGQDAQNYTFIQQSDIANTANSLEQANTPNPEQMIQPLIQPNEHLVGTPQCTPNVTHDHNAGDKANSVTVSVSFTCTGKVYDYDDARSLAAQLLKNQAMTDPGSSYALVGKIDTNVISATLTNAGQGIVALLVSAAGRWVYQFSPAQQQQLAQLIAGKGKQTALALLTSQPGVGNAAIQLQGSGNTLPTDPSLISIVIQPGP